ncbi:MAG: glycosyltransferase family 4 protein, partial [Oscillochloris sp.]|nr:glycosyltransferase family 4 protein [Oscillochloris sp.]
PDDHAALAGHIARVLGDRAYAEELRAGARRRAAEYGWPSIARRITAVYEELVDTSAAARAARRPFAQVS